MKKKSTGGTLKPYILKKKIKRRETLHPNLLLKKLNKLGDMSPTEANDVSPICPKSSHNNGAWKIEIEVFYPKILFLNSF
jgi:hypothetical protein